MAPSLLCCVKSRVRYFISAAASASVASSVASARTSEGAAVKAAAAAMNRRRSGRGNVVMARIWARARGETIRPSETIRY